MLKKLQDVVRQKIKKSPHTSDDPGFSIETWLTVDFPGDYHLVHTFNGNEVICYVNGHERFRCDVSNHPHIGGLRRMTFPRFYA